MKIINKTLRTLTLLIAVLIVALIWVRMSSRTSFSSGLNYGATVTNTNAVASSTASLLLDANSGRQVVRFVNYGSNDVTVVEISTSTGVVYGQGIVLKNGGGALEIKPDQRNYIYAGQFWVITSSGTSSVSVNQE